eukprot:3579796-Rhodomonas_salina.1
MQDLLPVIRQEELLLELNNVTSGRQPDFQTISASLMNIEKPPVNFDVISQSASDVSAYTFTALGLCQVAQHLPGCCNHGPICTQGVPRESQAVIDVCLRLEVPGYWDSKGIPTIGIPTCVLWYLGSTRCCGQFGVGIVVWQLGTAVSHLWYSFTVDLRLRRVMEQLREDARAD